MNVDIELDVTGKVCPLPLIALAKEVRKLSRGQVLRVNGDDPIFEEAVLDFSREGGHQILESSRDGRRISIVLAI